MLVRHGARQPAERSVMSNTPSRDAWLRGRGRRLEGHRHTRLVARRQRFPDLVEVVQRLAREVHLGHELVVASERHPEVDMRRPYPPVVADRIGAGLDGREPEAPFAIGEHLGPALEVRVERAGVAGVLLVIVAPVGVGLPDLDQGARDRLTGRVQHPALDGNELPCRAARTAFHPRQVGVLVRAVVRGVVRADGLGGGRLGARGVRRPVRTEPLREQARGGAGADAEEITTGNRRILWHVLSFG